MQEKFLSSVIYMYLRCKKFLSKTFLLEILEQASKRLFQELFSVTILSEVFFDEQNLRKTNVVSKSLLFTFQRDIVPLV